MESTARRRELKKETLFSTDINEKRLLTKPGRSVRDRNPSIRPTRVYRVAEVPGRQCHIRDKRGYVRIMSGSPIPSDLNFDPCITY